MSERREDRIERFLEPALAGLGYGLVRVRVLGTQRPKLQVMAERTDGRAMTVDDCADLSRAISPILDVEDPLAGTYFLEVSSPGIERPLVRAADFRRFMGREAAVATARPIGDRRRFKGTIAAADDRAVTLAVDGQSVEIPLADVRDAHLVFRDETLNPTPRRKT